MKDDSEDTPEEGEFTRFRSNIQLGDGPDQRGDVTVEVLRKRPARMNRTSKLVTLPGGEEVQTTVDNSAFAEFFHELSRGEMALREALDLRDDD